MHRNKRDDWITIKLWINLNFIKTYFRIFIYKIIVPKKA